MPEDQGTAPSRVRHACGALFLGVSTLASLALVLQEWGAMDAPGCGAASDCARAARSEFGHVPGLGWPLAIVGLVWFAALLAGWLRARGDVSVTWARLARSGVLVSLLLVGVLAVLRLACPYCLVAHGANVAFVILLELAPARAPSNAAREAAVATRSPWPATLVTGALVALAAAGGQAWARRGADVARENELRASLTALATPPTPSPANDARRALTGRHATRPDAPVRLVVFTDYQCEDCHDFDARLEAAVAGATDVSVALRHFPMNTTCNPHGANLHANACWAARAAEAAEVVGGDAAFRRMHAWLFARRGSFTNVELDAGITELGLDRARFLAALHAPATDARIAEDVALGAEVGLTATPMVFVNGVELRGWRADGALERAFAAARAARGTPTEDRPPSARERYLDLWRSGERVTLPVDPHPHVLGPRDARVQVVVWGDYQEPTCVQTDVELRDLTLQRGDVAYSFRAFPVNTACNPVAPSTQFPLACLAALGAEAASIVQGEDGFWALHDWLMTHRAELDDETMTRAAAELAIDRAAFWDALRLAELPARILEDVEAARSLGIASIPLVYVDGRRVEYRSLGGQSLLPAILEEAAQGR